MSTTVDVVGGCRAAAILVGDHAALAVPIACSLLLDLANAYAPLLVVAHVGDPELMAAVAMGNLVYNVCILSICYGIASGLNTLLAQAHGAWVATAAVAVRSDALIAPPARAPQTALQMMLGPAGDDTAAVPSVIVPEVPRVVPRASDARAARHTAEHPGVAYVRWTVVLLIAAALPLSALCIFSGRILALLRQPQGLSARAGRYCVVLLVTCGAPSVVRTLQGKVLQTARKAWPPAVATIAGTAANAATMSYFFVWGKDTWSARFPFAQLGWGPDEAYLVAALGKAAYAATAAGVTGAYLILSRNAICGLGCLIAPRCCGACGAAPRAGRRERHGHLNVPMLERSGLLQPIAAQSGWARCAERGATARLVLRLALPSMLMMIAEWWSFELLALLAGWLPRAQDPTRAVAANGVLFVVCVVAYQISKALAIATGVLGEFSLSTVTFYANRAHNLTRSP
jgi:Na+-driven multidrug efflux pump